MSKKPRNMLSDAMDIPPDVMEAARKKVQMEQAVLLAQAEMGVSDEDPDEDKYEPTTKRKLKRGPNLPKGTEMKDIFLNLAEHSDRITIDGTAYMHGRSYTVPKPTYDTIMEIMSRGWAHQAQVDGKSENYYRKQQDVRLRDPNANRGATV